MVVRPSVFMIVFALVLSACASPQSRPVEFEGMAANEVGCAVSYGEADRVVIGPLGPSDFEEIHPNDYTMFRIARTALGIIVVVEQERGESHVSIPLDDLPVDGIVSLGPFRDGGNPGYVITCWKGDG